MPFDLTAFASQVVAAGGTSAGVLYAALRYGSTKWLDSLFARPLEKLKHEQQTELEKVKHDQQKEIEQLRQSLTRLSKLQDTEFDVLPKVWFMLQDAQGMAYNYVARLKWSPRFDQMPEEQFEEFLTTTQLSPYQKNALRESSNRNAYFRKVTAGLDFDAAQEKHRLFNNYLVTNRIFLTDELRELFDAFSKDLSLGLNQYEHGKDGGDHKLEYEGVMRITNLTEKTLEIEKAVIARLQYARTLL